MPPANSHSKKALATLDRWPYREAPRDAPLLQLWPKFAADPPFRCKKQQNSSTLWRQAGEVIYGLTFGERGVKLGLNQQESFVIPLTDYVRSSPAFRPHDLGSELKLSRELNPR